MNIEEYKRLALELAQSKEADLPHFDFFARTRARAVVEATAMGLKYFVYMGAVYENTKDFCRERVGKVFSLDELQAWKDDPGRPEIEGYDPVLHLGGYNCFEGENHCNHGLQFIPDSYAARKRPDLPVRSSRLEVSWEELTRDLTHDEVQLVGDFAAKVLDGRSGLEAIAFDMMARRSIALVLSDDGVVKDGRRMSLAEALPYFTEVLIQGADRS